MFRLSKKIQAAVGIIVILAFLGGGLPACYKQQDQAAQQAAALQKWETQLKLAEIGKNEGVEHAFIRQLMVDPSTFGFGKVEDAKDPKKWAGREAHRLAVKAGYVNLKTGKEIRVKVAGKVAYVLQKDKDGNLGVNEFQKGADGKYGNPADTNKLAPDYKSASFEGKDVKAKVQWYEYVWAKAARK